MNRRQQPTPALAHTLLQLFPDHRIHGRGPPKISLYTSSSPGPRLVKRVTAMPAVTRWCSRAAACSSPPEISTCKAFPELLMTLAPANASAAREAEPASPKISISHTHLPPPPLAPLLAPFSN